MAPVFRSFLVVLREMRGCLAVGTLDTSAQSLLRRLDGERCGLFRSHQLEPECGTASDFGFHPEFGIMQR